MAPKCPGNANTPKLNCVYVTLHNPAVGFFQAIFDRSDQLKTEPSQNPKVSFGYLRKAVRGVEGGGH